MIVSNRLLKGAGTRVIEQIGARVCAIMREYDEDQRDPNTSPFSCLHAAREGESPRRDAKPALPIKNAGNAVT